MRPTHRLRAAAIALTAAFVAPGAGAAADDEPSRRSAVLATDLTGDGLDDVLIDESRWNGSTTVHTLEARRGTDGGVLWRVPLEPSFVDEYELLVLRTGDVTGDGLGDVIVVDDHDRPRSSCVHIPDCDDRYDRLLRLLSGTGEWLWTRRYEIEVAYDQTAQTCCGLLPASTTSSHRFQIVNVPSFPVLAGDHDGDGLRDLVVNVRDSFRHRRSNSLGAAGISRRSEERVDRTTTTGHVLRGVNGTVLFTREAVEHPGWAALAPAGDAVGNPAQDLLWVRGATEQLARSCTDAPIVGSCTGSPTVADLKIEMIDGSTLRTAWRARLRDPDSHGSGASAVGGDLDGDGAADVHASHLIDDDPTAPVYRHVMMSGRDGALLWTRDERRFRPEVVGPVGGGAGDDLVWATHASDDSTSSVTLERVDGATGETLFTTTHTVDVPPDGYGYVSVEPAGDGDGDGSTDLLILRSRFGPVDGDDARTYVVESAATGEVLYRRVEDASLWVLPAGDADADGRADLLELRRRETADRESLSISAISIAVGTLWTREDMVVGPPLGASPMRTADQSGLGGDDLILRLNFFIGDGIRHVIHSVELRDGTIGWTVGELP